MKYTPKHSNILVIMAERFPDSWEYYNFGEYKLNKKELIEWFSENESENENKWWIDQNDYQWLTVKIIDLA